MREGPVSPGSKPRHTNCSLRHPLSHVRLLGSKYQARATAVTNPKIQRRRVETTDKLRKSGLIGASENRNCLAVDSERSYLPLVRPEGGKRNASIVLDDRLRMGEHKIPHHREPAAMH